MSRSGLNYFKLLKAELEKKYKKEEITCNLEITKWRQKEIIRFQELMQRDINDRISEKWFYTHIKNENNTKLPRIDTLNLLCRFLDFADWDDFIKKNELRGKFAKKQLLFKPLSVKLKRGIWLSLAVLVLMFLVVVFTNVDLLAQEKYSFCFVDSDSGESLDNTDIEILVLHDNQSSEIIACNEAACFEYETNLSKISFVVKAAYYKSDTIVRILNRKRNSEIIKLRPDDYALMIHIFSSSKMDDWQKRRGQLDDMIANNAKIYQIDYYENRGIEIYNKEDFINKMTMPINSLKNIEIIETQYVDNRISMMRFIQAIDK